MLTRSLSTTSLAISAIIVSGCATQQPNDVSVQCSPTQSVENSEGSLSGLTLVGSYVSNSPFDSSAAEIVTFDSCTDQLFVVNAQSKRVDVLALNGNNQPSLKTELDLNVAASHANIRIGAANSVAVYEGLLAVAIENAVKQENGLVALYRADSLELITTFETGALPDMVAFSKDGQYIATANEGEPNSDYSTDPEGSITLIDLSQGLGEAKSFQIGFGDFNQGQSRHHELDSDVRISAPNASVAQDLEPEYLSFSDDGYLYVALQENNALAKIDLSTKRIERIKGLGEKHWADYQLDASNKDKIIGNFQSYPMLTGLYMPDSIDSYQVDGKTYVISANEGDGREYGFKTTQKACENQGYNWDGDDYSGSDKYSSEVDFCIAYSDEIRGAKLKVPSSHPLSAALKDKKQIGRLKVIKPEGQLSDDSHIQSFGTRSFSIWDENGQLVFDSGDQFADVVYATQPEHLNSSNDSNSSADSRSDDKGVEPEAIEVAAINGRQIAFIGLERQGGIMVYDVTNPRSPMFLHYKNNRDFSKPVCTEIDDGDCVNGNYNPEAGDLGPESIHYFTRKGQHLLAVGNEVSGTTTIYRLEF
ncbi:choice-of-anchor I family protein [Vibrio europaeus]|uniref:choice-of-anchor I family protein n=1 Tax=Vibrio europaeus TaxID=300876 RepID=UPI00148C6E6E|nr:choice-of-anchor I family protein [Vibrio europaeus]NOH24653.1 alkaline phosphatase [Vibrio europaeus]